MKEVWFLLVTLFVLEPDGNIDERKLYSVRQPGERECVLEARAREDLYTRYLGKDHVRRYTYAAPYCTFGFCQDDDNGTYQIRLNGTLVAFEVGCESRQERIPSKWTPIPETGKEEKNDRASFHSF